MNLQRTCALLLTQIRSDQLICCKLFTKQPLLRKYHHSKNKVYFLKLLFNADKSTPLPQFWWGLVILHCCVKSCVCVMFVTSAEAWCQCEPRFTSHTLWFKWSTIHVRSSSCALQFNISTCQTMVGIYIHCVLCAICLFKCHRNCNFFSIECHFDVNFTAHTVY